jgi:type VI secretion system protein ImpB
MPPPESLQHKLDRVRRPRVHLTYDVEIDGALVEKELPFVVGVLADLAGNRPARPLPPLKNRDFVAIDRDNFDEVMAGIKPRLVMQVDNALQGDGSRLNVELCFNRMADFEPGQVVRQVKPLRELLAERERLANLLHKLDGNEQLEDALQRVIRDSDALRRLGLETGRTTTPDGEE